jgi:hypothetical protein
MKKKTHSSQQRWSRSGVAPRISLSCSSN